ncbi:hypothetical protein JCM15831A_03430 [Asaia astilbis]
MKGRVSRKIIKNKHGKTDIDVIAENGDIITVVGPAKANKLDNFVRGLRVYKE